MKTALLIVDVQNDYFPNGKMELVNSNDTGNKINSLIEHFRKVPIEIVYIQHISTRPSATFFLPNTQGMEIHDSVKPKMNEKVIIKNYPNSFRETELDSYLKSKSISKLIVTGMMTHMCIDTTVRAAFDLGYDCIVVEDCCTTKNLKIGDREISSNFVQDSFMAALNGVFAKVLSSEDLLKLYR